MHGTVCYGAVSGDVDGVLVKGKPHLLCDCGGGGGGSVTTTTIHTESLLVLWEKKKE